MEEDAADMQTVVLREPDGWTAEVSLHGGHVSSWKNSEGEELLYVSPSGAIFQGIQVCFPEFRGPSPPELLRSLRSSHNYQIDQNTLGIPSTSSVPNESSVDLVWTSVVTMPDGSPSEDSVQNAGSDTPVYTLRQRITLQSSRQLNSDFWVTNAGIKPFKFKFALLNHFPVSDNDEVKFRREGLEKLNKDEYLELKGQMIKEHQGWNATYRGSDIYLVMPTTISIKHPGKRLQVFALYRKNLPKVVLWNPRDESTSILARLGLSCLSCHGATNDLEDEYKHVLSVGGAVNDEIELQPKEVWHASQVISAVRSHQLMGRRMA